MEITGLQMFFLACLSFLSIAAGELLQLRFILRLTGVKANAVRCIVFLFVRAIFFLLWMQTDIARYIPWRILQPMVEILNLLIIWGCSCIVLRIGATISAASAGYVVLVNILFDCMTMPFQLLGGKVLSFIFSELLSILAPLILLLLYHVLERKFPIRRLAYIRNKYILLALTPALLMCLQLRMLAENSIIFSMTPIGEGTPLAMRFYVEFQISSAAPDIVLLFCAAAFAVFCAYGCLFLFQKMMDGMEIERKEAQLNQQLAMQKACARQAQMRYEMTRRFRHDIKNHMAVLQKLLTGGQNREAAAYLQNVEQAACRLSFPVHTGSLVLDALLEEKLALAQQEGIAVSCEVMVPPSCQISEYDLSTVFFNALDNAIEACRELPKENRKIDLKARRSQDFFLVDMINSCKEDAKTMRPGGLGISTMRAVAEKYGGSLLAEANENNFSLTVLFTLSVQEENQPV